MPSSTVLTLYSSSHALDPARLHVGEDVVLDIPVQHGASLPYGVLIDDHLDDAQREAIDRDAEFALTAWHRRYDEEFLCGRVSVADVWHTELYSEVFLPAVRILRGLRSTLEATGCRSIISHGLDPELADALSHVLAPIPVRSLDPGPIQRYPGEDAAPPSTTARSPRWQRRLRSMFETVGLPGLAWGDMIIVPYGSTEPVMARLAAGRGPAPVVYMPFPPRVGQAIRGALRGGWTGLPGSRGYRRAESTLADQVARARAVSHAPLLEPGIDDLLRRRALRCLSDRASRTVALAETLRRQFGRRRFSAVLVPFDHEPIAKVLVRTAQAAGVPVVALQHGYEPRKSFHPGEFSDALGQWSRWDLDALPRARRHHARVVGNPARGVQRGGPASAANLLNAVILVEHSSRLSAMIDRRITAQHLAVAFEGLRRSRSRWRIIVRPHPSDDRGALQTLTSQLADSPVEIDTETPILELLSNVHVCVGAISTAALQSALTGTALVMLMPKPLLCLPPLDGSGHVMHATSSDELARAIDVATSAHEPPGRVELLQALGHGPADPTSAVLDWMQELAAARRSR